MSSENDYGETAHEQVTEYYMIFHRFSHDYKGYGRRVVFPMERGRALFG